jgi:uncharacterized YceG family protein
MVKRFSPKEVLLVRLQLDPQICAIVTPMKLVPSRATLLRACLLLSIILIGVVFSLPLLLSLNIAREQSQRSTALEQFPVTVNPTNKTIVENPQVNALFENPRSPFQAALWNVEDIAGKIFDWLALAIANAPWYQNIAAVNGRFVTIIPGMRKEQVAHAFANTLAWDNKQKQEFLAAAPNSLLQLSEGSFAPGVYPVALDTTPKEARIIVGDRFYKDVLSRYGTTTMSIVPLSQALTIASLIEREKGVDDMRIISGIIWNRLFIGMNLQIDATLQYAKANSAATKSWWPGVAPGDQFRKSPYNTYLHPGLPPSPIANPSVASILAALNPRETSCMFYFHDARGKFHCTDTYAEHVALLKKYYGRGK